MKPYKTSPPDVTVLENGTVRTPDDLFPKDINALEIMNVPLQDGRCAAFYSLLGRQIMRRDANFKATNRFYCGHRENVCKIFPSLVDEVQVQARIQIHPCTHQFEPTSFELRIDCSTRNLAVWPRQELVAGKGIGL
jgi:hypothetical protein